MARYRTYRGRGRRGASVLLVLFLLLIISALLFFALQDYLVYSADGVRLFAWEVSPAGQRPDVTGPPLSPDIDLVIHTPTQTPPESPSPTPVHVAKLYSIGVPLGLLEDMEKLRSLKDFALTAGVNSIVIEIKNSDGEIAKAERLTEAAEILKDPAITLTARISTFKDNKITREKERYGIKHTSGVNWLDNSRNRYLNPYIPEVREFVIGCVLMARDAGFECVLLDDVHFPYFGSLSQIGYGENATISHVSAMNTFLDELAEQTDGLTLHAVILEDTLSSGSHPEAGQELGKFKTVFDEFYYYVPDDMSVLREDGIPIFQASDGELRQRLRQAEDIGYLVMSGNGEFNLGAFEK